MTNKNIRVIVSDAVNCVVKDKTRAAKVLASIDERETGLLVYLSHGATLGEAQQIQTELERRGLRIPDALGNAVIYVTA